MADQDRDPQLAQEAPSNSPKLEFIGEPAAQGALFGAVAEASTEFGTILNDSKGQIGNRYFKYADLETLVSATRPALAKHGVAVMQFMVGPDEIGNHRLTTVVAGHGARIQAHIDYKRVNDLKGWGMQTTYLRRYAYRALFQLDGSDDADSAAAQESAPPARQQSQARPPEAPPKAAPKAQPKPPSAPPATTNGAPKESGGAPKEAADVSAATGGGKAENPPEQNPVTQGAGVPVGDAPPRAGEGIGSSPPPPAAEATPPQTEQERIEALRPLVSQLLKTKRWDKAHGAAEDFPKFNQEIANTFCVYTIGKGPKNIQTVAEAELIVAKLKELPDRQFDLPVA